MKCVFIRNNGPSRIRVKTVIFNYTIRPRLVSHSAGEVFRNRLLLLHDVCSNVNERFRARCSIHSQRRLASAPVCVCELFMSYRRPSNFVCKYCSNGRSDVLTIQFTRSTIVSRSRVQSAIRPCPRRSSTGGTD